MKLDLQDLIALLVLGASMVALLLKPQYLCGVCLGALIVLVIPFYLSRRAKR